MQAQSIFRTRHSWALIGPKAQESSKPHALGQHSRDPRESRRHSIGERRAQAAMEKSPPETAAAAAEVAARFRSLVDTGDIGAIRQTQHLMYVGTASPPPSPFPCPCSPRSLFDRGWSMNGTPPSLIPAPRLLSRWFSCSMI